jgi:predicted transcriptional regulator
MFAKMSTLQISLNGVEVQRRLLPNHPHDARGALSYLRAGRGAYGYSIHATIDEELLRQVNPTGEHWHLRCAVPEDAEHPGGLTIYAADAGRFPFSLTLIVE